MATATASTSEMLASVRADVGNGGAIESAEWMNQIVAQLWPFISTFIQTTLKRDVEPLVNEQVPTWLGSLSFGKVSLGSTPLRIEGLDVISTGPAGTRLEADIYYDGDAAVSIDVVTKLLGTLSLGVQHIKLSGTIQFVMSPLVPVLPLMAATQLAFINRPTIAMDLTGLADVDQAASIKTTISNTIVNVLSGLLVLPNRVAAKVDPAADYFETYVPPAGVLRGTVAAGRNFVPQAGFFTTDDPDVYVIATLGGVSTTTPTVNNNVAPVWGTPFSFLVHNVRQALSLAAWEDDTAGDDALGVGAISAADLTASGEAWLPIAPAPTADGAAAPPAGDVQLTGHLHGLDVAAPLTETDDPAAPIGLLVALIDGATGLAPGVAASARLRLTGSKEVVEKATAVAAVTAEAPVAAWNAMFELLVGAADVASGVLALDVLDGGSEGVGGLKLPLSSIVAAPSRTVVMDKGLLEGGSSTGSVRVKFFLYGISA
ncbi:hypothetical protein MMPV_003872 [Pyropia vietnamensis]